MQDFALLVVHSSYCTMAEAAWEAEKAVGIECFANDLPGFTAILKHRSIMSHRNTEQGGVVRSAQLHQLQ